MNPTSRPLAVLVYVLPERALAGSTWSEKGLVTLLTGHERYSLYPTNSKLQDLPKDCFTMGAGLQVLCLFSNMAVSPPKLIHSI